MYRTRRAGALQHLRHPHREPLPFGLDDLTLNAVPIAVAEVDLLAGTHATHRDRMACLVTA